MADIASELDKLAKEPACSNLATILDRLATDFRAGEIQRWANVDILRQLDPDEVVVARSATATRRLEVLDLFRTLALFLPLLFTWGGIFFAVHAYRGLLNAPQEEQARFQDASFLQMWTQGFGHRTWVTLDVVALFDLIAIAVVVVLFGSGGWLQRRADHENDTVRRDIVRQLRSVATEAALAVSEQADSRPDRLLVELNQLAPALQETLRSLVAAQKELVASAEAGRASSTALTAATGGLANAAKGVADGVGELTTNMASIGATAGRFDDTARSLVDSMSDVTEQLPLIRNQLHDHLQTAAQFSDRVDVLHKQHLESLSGIVPLYEQTLQHLREAQSEIVATVAHGKQNVEDLVRASGAMANAGSVVAGSADGLQAHITSIAAATGTFETTVQSLLSGATTMNSRLPALQKDVVDVLGAVKSVGAKLDSLYERQEVLVRDLGHVIDVPLAAAAAAKRTAKLADATEAALLKTLTKLPGEMEKLGGAMIATLDRELAERRAAADAMSGTSAAAEQMVSSAEQVMRAQLELTSQTVRRFEQELEATAATLAQSSRDAAATLTQAIDRLRETPPHVLPDLHQVHRQLAENLDASRRLLEALSNPGRGGAPRRGRISSLLRRRRPIG
ncbi:hypothetical protein ACN27J_19800 [Solwaraspora sp. WMMB762]|uniref:hypothetical protein n=1 Tax=Solwaraspora sp. WMMB762 TaxID=3404120 RepID=UPI003B928E4F